MQIRTAPLYALFSLDFYKHVIRSGLSKGIFYLLYLTLIATVVFLFFVMTKILPMAEEFVDWGRSEMPPMTWQNGSLSTAQSGPYTMVHPQLGPVIAFDTSREEIRYDEMGDLQMFVTSKRLYMRQGDQNLRVHDLTQLAAQSGSNIAAGSPFQFDGESLVDIYKKMKPLLVTMLLVLFAPFFFIWNLIVAMLYSLIGVLMNLLRASKLYYSTILNVTFFALTPALAVQMLQTLIPGLDRLPFGLLGSLLVTGITLYFAILKTQESSPTIEPPAAA